MDMSISGYYHRLFVPLGRTLFVYDYDGNQIVRLRFARYVHSTSVSSDGRVAYVTADDDLVALDARAGAIRWRKHTGGIAGHLALAAGRVWVVSDVDGVTKLLSVNPNLPTRGWVEVPAWGNTHAHVITGAGGTVPRIAWAVSNDEGSITAATAHADGTISGRRIYGSTGAKELAPGAAQYSANGAVLAFTGDEVSNPDGSHDSALGVWNLSKTGFADTTFVTTHGTPVQVAVSPSSRHLVGTIHGALYVWATSNPRTPVKTVPFSWDAWPSLQGLAVTPDGTYAYCMVTEDADSSTQSYTRPVLVRIRLGISNW